MSRSKVYQEPARESAENLDLMKRIDRLYLKEPTFGYRRVTAMLRRQGLRINEKRVYRLMGVMGLEAIYPKPRTSVPAPGHRVFPYLLRHRRPHGPNQVWSMDITYIPMKLGFMYLMAVMDWWSRYVLAWDVSNTMEAELCVQTVEAALRHAKASPYVFNTDQGSQFTSELFTGHLASESVLISMDGRGRALDNVFIERLWRSVKYENIYLQDYETGQALTTGLDEWFTRYNSVRPHQSLGYATPWEYHYQGENHGAQPAPWWSEGGLVA